MEKIKSHQRLKCLVVVSQNSIQFRKIEPKHWPWSWCDDYFTHNIYTYVFHWIESNRLRRDLRLEIEIIQFWKDEKKKRKISKSIFKSSFERLWSLRSNVTRFDILKRSVLHFERNWHSPLSNHRLSTPELERHLRAESTKTNIFIEIDNFISHIE